MLEYIKENYSQILTLIFIVICVVLVIVSFFQKDDSKKKEFSLVLFRETKYNHQNSKNVNTYALIRKYVLIYQIVLFDNKGNKIFYSNIYPSREKAINNFYKLKDSIINSYKLVQETIDHKYYVSYLYKGKMIGFSCFFDRFDENESIMKQIEKHIDCSLNQVPQFDDSITSYSRSNKPTKIKNLLINKVLNKYEIDLVSNNRIILKSYESLDKNDLKGFYDDAEEAIKAKRIYIENIDSKYRYLILSKQYQILCFGKMEDNKESVNKDLEEIYNNLY